MGMPARKIEADRGVRQRPDLRVVKKTAPKRGTSQKRNPAPKASSSRRSASVAQQNFRMFAVLVGVVAVLGLGRVWLSVLAAEASLESSQLRHDIKNERYEGDMLEIQQSALSSPSRIRAIASAAFDMAPAEDVTYIDIREPKSAKPQMQAARPIVTGSAAMPARTTAAATGASSKPKGVLAEVLDVAAGEARVLLIGDVGLAAAR